ncbi:SDR family oxidoreductase [Pseudomonas gingeri]|uniref:SDR family oxidoreductase n=1 Tax=Pseudomonas gingeri TaxID=117681 RepID=A0A7Y7X9E5_9PSED|nr:SDR family oxidoreductase [Pseudomonas gingeri]NWB95705.1 SDR family oxidoreductase [Pseudomonas gingeri]
MEQYLQGKTALITGSSRGIGRAIALELAQRGAAVCIAFRSNKDEAEKVVKSVESLGGKAIAVKADVSIMDDIYRLYDEVESKLGKLDIVVSNAGIAINKPLVEYTIEDYTSTFDTNTRGAFFVMQQAALRINDGGRIIAISSGGTKLLLSGTSLYLGSKGAVEQFVRGLSKELGARNITVNAVSPGFTNTELLTEDLRTIAAEMSPFNRVGEPQEVAAVVCFVASSQASWVNGQNIGVGGGVM